MLAALREGLEALFAEDLRRLDAAFLQGRPLRAKRRERPFFDALEAARLAKRLAPGLYAACVRLIRLDGRWIASDRLDRAGADQVFTLMFEQVYTIRNMDVREGEDVLELCAGSGALSLFAAGHAARVTAVDVSPRALAFARFNLALNACARPVDLVQGSLFEPLDRDRRFDHVILNPPFEPVPPGTETFLHSDAGEDGLDVIRAVLEGLPRHLAPGGRLTMITWSPGDADGPLLADLLRVALPSCRIRLALLESGPLAPVLERFAKERGYAAWRERLASRDLTHLHFVFAQAREGAEPGLEVTHPEDEVAACHAIADDWL